MTSAKVLLWGAHGHWKRVKTSCAGGRFDYDAQMGTDQGVKRVRIHLRRVRPATRSSAHVAKKKVYTLWWNGSKWGDVATGGVSAHDLQFPTKDNGYMLKVRYKWRAYTGFCVTDVKILLIGAHGHWKSVKTGCAGGHYDYEGKEGPEQGPKLIRLHLRRRRG